MKSNRRNILKALGLAPILPFVRLNNPFANGNPECITSDDIEGPFYIQGAPKSDQIASLNAPGTKLFITGSVYYNDCKTPIMGAEVDVWQAGDAGGYEENDSRGIVTTNASGNFSFQSVLPGKYLNGAQFRPRHLHYKIRFGSEELTTQIYFEGDTSIAIDPWASQADAADRIISLVEDSKGAMHGVTDIYLDVEPLIDSIKSEDKNSSASILFVGKENDSSDHSIKIRLHQSGVVSLFIYDLNGRPVTTLIDQQRLSAGEHAYSFEMQHQLGISLSTGVYIARLHMNGVPSDAKRFFSGK